MKDIFEKDLGGQICYSRSMEDRMTDIRFCKNIDDLQAALKTDGLQKAVEKAIHSRIKKLKQQIT